MSDNPFNVEVLVLAAGRGERLKPLTDTTPKPLLRVGEKTLLEYSLLQLAAAGFKSIWINVHHLPEAIPAFLGDGRSFGLTVSYSLEQRLLDTGGALANIPQLRAASNVLILNADALFLDPIPFHDLIRRQLALPKSSSGESAATLLLKAHADAAKFGVIRADTTGQVTNFIGNTIGATPSGKEQDYLYTGCMVLGSAVLSQLPAPGSICSLTRDLLVRAVDAGYSLSSVEYSGEWIDVGTPERLEEASKLVAAQSVQFSTERKSTGK